MMVWPYDNRGRLVGEEVWEPEPEEVELIKLEPSEVLTVRDLRRCSPSAGPQGDPAHYSVPPPMGEPVATTAHFKEVNNAIPFSPSFSRRFRHAHS
jgi:hypothetical protein